MTEIQAAAELAALLNKIQAAGHQCSINHVSRGEYLIEVGDQYAVMEPLMDDGEWLVVG